MTLQERLREYSERITRYSNSTGDGLVEEAADALDAQADKINRLSARCESQRLKIDAQEKRIRELEGALREWLDAEDLPSGVWATDLRRVNDIMKRAHAALIEENARLRKHAEAMEQAARKLAFTGAAFGVAALDDACDAYRADFPKEEPR